MKNNVLRRGIPLFAVLAAGFSFARGQTFLGSQPIAPVPIVPAIRAPLTLPNFGFTGTGSLSGTRSRLESLSKGLRRISHPLKTDQRLREGFDGAALRRRRRTIEAPEARDALRRRRRTIEAPEARDALRRGSRNGNRIIGFGSGNRIPPAPLVYFNGKSFPSYAFSHQTNVSGLLIDAIDATEKSIEITIHGFTLLEVAEALLKAKERDALLRARSRDVEIRIVIDEKHVYPRKITHYRADAIQFLIDNGFDIRTIKGNGYGTQHNKFAVFDGKLVLTGSYNWTNSANSRNNENVQFVDEKARVQGYSRYWRWMWTQAKPYSDRTLEDVEGKLVGSPPVDPSPSVDFYGFKFPRYAFSPSDLTEKLIIKAIEFSRKSIDIAMFAFFSPQIADALIEKYREGNVPIRVIVDKGQGKRSPAVKKLLEAGVEVLWGTGHNGGVMHNKFAVFDGLLLVTGSYNWSENAQFNNLENSNFHNDYYNLAGFSAYFEYLYDSSSVPDISEFKIAPEKY